MHFVICIFQNWKYAKHMHFTLKCIKIPDFNQNSKYAFLTPWKYAKKYAFYTVKCIFFAYFQGLKNAYFPEFWLKSGILREIRKKICIFPRKMHIFCICPILKNANRKMHIFWHEYFQFWKMHIAKWVQNAYFLNMFTCICPKCILLLRPPYVNVCFHEPAGLGFNHGFSCADLHFAGLGLWQAALICISWRALNWYAFFDMHFWILICIFWV